MTQNEKEVSSFSITSAARIASVILSTVVILGTVLDTFTKTVGLLDLLIPGAVLGALAVVLGVIARSKGHIIFGIASTVFPILWFLLIVKIFGFV